MRHDEIVEVVRRALRRGGLPSTKEPGLAILHPSALGGPQPPASEGQQCTTPERVKFIWGGVQAVIAFCLNKPSPCPCSNTV
jgi:hypothetical protein